MTDGGLLLAFTVVPAGAGAALGALVRVALRGRPRARRTALFVGAVALLGVPGAAPLIPWIGFYDIVTVALIALVGWVAGATTTGTLRTVAPRFALAGVAGALTLAAAELVVRRLPWTPGGSRPDPSPLRWHFEPEDREFGCRAIFAGDYPDRWFGHLRRPEEIARRPGLRRIVHVGDSMTEAADVPDEASFSALLAAAHPGEEHLNLGITYTGTDVHLLVARAWTPRLRPDLVVLHVFPGNDIVDMGRPYACCADGPLIERAPGGPTARCAHPRWRMSFRRLLGQGPPPLVARILGRRLVLFRRIDLAFRRLQAAVPDDRPAYATQWELFGASLLGIRDALAAHGVPFVVAVLPNRWSLEPDSPGAGETGQRGARTHDRIVALAEAAGITTVSAQAVFEDALRRQPGTVWFQRQRSNPHFEVAGHVLYARWLAARLASLPGGEVGAALRGDGGRPPLGALAR